MSRSCDQLTVDEFDRADIETAGRLHRQHHLRLAIELAGDDELLLIATRERSSRCLRSGSAHIELRHFCRGDFASAGIVDPAALAEWRKRAIAEQHVLSQ